MMPLVPWKMLAHRDPLAQGTLHNRARRELIVPTRVDSLEVALLMRAQRQGNANTHCEIVRNLST